MEVQIVSQDDAVAYGKLKSCLINAKSLNCSCPVLVCIWAYFGIPISLYNNDVFLGVIHYSGIYKFINL